MEREYIKITNQKKEIIQTDTRPEEILSDEDRMTRKFYEPLVRIISPTISWNY